MAVKIVRQPNKIALLGSPTSAAAMEAGHEGAPAALRAAGLVERLRSIGYDVADLGDDPAQLYQPDEENPRARNVSRVLAALNALKPRVEQAIKSNALPLILGGDCSIALATLAAARRYFRHVGLIYMDGDADLHTPATTSSGSLDGMVISHVVGRGAAELVRFWGEPPLVREPDVALFGVHRLDPPEQQQLDRSSLRRYPADDVRRRGPAVAAAAAVERIHGNDYEFVLHFDVDTIAGFSATNCPGPAGLQLEEAREALEVFAKQKNLAAIEVTAYNPAKDPDGSGARLVVDLVADVLAKRLEALRPVAPSVEAVAVAEQPSVAAASPAPGAESPEITTPLPAAAPGEAWSSDSIPQESSGEQTEAEPAGTSSDAGDPQS